MRGARHGDVPGFRHPPDGGTACAQCQDVAGAAQLEIRGRGAARSESTGIALFRQFSLRITASRLHGPPPAKARYKNVKQRLTARSPSLRIGKNPCGKCSMKYAAAISPDRIKATGRVNRPRIKSVPPTSSNMPAMPNSESQFKFSKISTAGQPNSLD